MDPDVIEIPPPIHHPSNFYLKNKVILHDVIDVDNDDDSEDVMIIGEKVNNSNKGKTIDAVHGDLQVVNMSDYPFPVPDVEKFGSVGGIASSNNPPSVSNNVINVDGHGSDLSYDDDDYVGILSAEDYMDADEYTLLQKHFDHVDIPPGIEAPFTWLPPGYDVGFKKTENSMFYPWDHMQSNAALSFMTPSSQPSMSLGPTNSKIQATSMGGTDIQIKKKTENSMFYPWDHMQSNAALSSMTPSSQPSMSLGPTNSKIQATSMGGTDIQIKMEDVAYSSGTSPQFFSQSVPSKKKSATSKPRGRTSNTSVGIESSKSHWFSGSFHSKKKSASAYLGGKFKTAMMADGSSVSSHSNFIGQQGSSHTLGTDPGKSWWKISENHKSFSTHQKNVSNNIYYPFDPLVTQTEHGFDNSVPNFAGHGFNGKAVDGPIVTTSDEAKDEIMRKFRSFKQFDTVEDTSDHYFVHNSSSTKRPPKNWAKKIQDEWKILQKDLPDSIFVRVYESNMDLLRAVIIGAEGTPYHDGLFFFDVFFPSGYPNVPPQVHYHSGGLRLNPNLYHCGKVCLSLLNTWSGSKNEKWLPGTSTILQVLVSIQGLILNTKPYFNEPGYELTSGSASGEKLSFKYNEDTFILSLRTMMYMIRRPPKNFEDFVKGHFCSRASDILVACKAYMEGAQVGCLVKGGVQDVDEGDRSCSQNFKHSLAGYMNMLVKEFAQTGAKDIQKFLPPPPPTVPVKKPSGGVLLKAAT